MYERTRKTPEFITIERKPAWIAASLRVAGMPFNQSKLASYLDLESIADPKKVSDVMATAPRPLVGF